VNRQAVTEPEKLFPNLTERRNQDVNEEDARSKDSVVRGIGFLVWIGSENSASQEIKHCRGARFSIPIRN